MPSNKFFLKDQRNQVNYFNYYYFTDAFNDDEISEICRLGDSVSKYSAVTGNNDKPNDYRKSDISWIDESPESNWLYEKVAEYANKANKEMWNFDIWGYQDSFQYTIYNGGGGHYEDRKSTRLNSSHT